MWIKLSGAFLAAMSMINLADAGLLGSLRGCGAEKGCGCASTCQPACCKPVIVKPCCPNVYTYQRKCSDIKPPCCDTCCPPATCCAPAANACNNGCAPAAAPACAAPAACAPAAAPACAAPAACAPAACAPAAAPACAAPAACGPAAAPACAAPCAPAAAACTPACAPAACGCGKKGGLLSGLFSSKKLNCGSCNTCAAPAACNTCAAPAKCNAGCNTCAAPAACTPACEVRCCNADPCEIAKLIYESQTACYAKDRRSAIRKLGNKFDCICNPEIMTALIVGLNDCDERVRREAADEIGDQIKKNCCCCPQVVAALTCALGDCDKHVVKQATEALERCGYEVVNGCCDPCATAAAPACGNNGCAPAPAAAPAPVPPCTTGARSTGLQNLLGMLD